MPDATPEPRVSDELRSSDALLKSILLGELFSVGEVRRVARDLRDARATIASQAEALAAKEAEVAALTERLGQMTVARDVIADFQKEQSARADAAEAERDQLRISIVDLDRVVDQLDIANTVVDPAEAIAELQTRLATAEAALKAAREADGKQMVPVEPTREMWAAGANAIVGYKQRHHDKVVADVWSAMLKAVLSPPTKES